MFFLVIGEFLGLAVGGAIMASDGRVCNGLTYAGSAAAALGGTAMAMTSGHAQGAGAVAAICGVIGIFLPQLFLFLREYLKHNAEKVELRRRIAEFERRAPRIEHNAYRVEVADQPAEVADKKADVVLALLRQKGWLDAESTDEIPSMPAIPPRVLVVEDDDNTRSALVALLGREGFAVDKAYTAKEAIHRLDSPRPFDAAVLDLRISGGTGEEVLAHIRERRLSTRVVVVTGVEDADRLAALEALGADRVLKKPIDFDDFIAVLRADTEAGHERGALMFAAVLSLSSIPDAVWNALIAGIVTIILRRMYLRYLLDAMRIERKVAGVAAKLESATTNTDDKLDAIKRLANGAYGGQMRLTWMALQRAADATKDPADAAAATEAKRLYDEHMVASATNGVNP